MTHFVNKLIHTELEPFDLLFRNFFDQEAFFAPVIESKLKYPVDIFETNKGLQFDIAIVGLCDKDVNIEVTNGDTLNVSYEKKDEENGENEEKEIYLHQGIAKRSFSLGWKIGNKFDLNKIDAVADKGLLSITVPVAKGKEPKQITIKSK